jgi:hypothetical protein
MARTISGRVPAMNGTAVATTKLDGQAGILDVCLSLPL